MPATARRGIMDAMDAADPGSEPTFFERTVIGWDITFWVLLAIALAAVLTGDVPSNLMIVGSAIAAVLGVAYATIGRTAMRRRTGLARHVYLVLLVLACAGLFAITPESSFLLFIAFPQIWAYTESVRAGMAYTAVMVGGLALATMIRSGFSTDVLLTNVPWLVVSLAVSFLLGTWISKVIDESLARKELIQTLETTRVQLGAANHAAGVVAERERLAREIHDTLAQGFTGIITLAGAAQALVARGDLDQAATRLATIEDIARDNLGEARALVAAFSPLGLDDSTLVEALHRLAMRFEAQTGVRVAVRARSGDDVASTLPAGHQVVLLRTAQEALANVRKHASATQVSIELSTSADGHATIEVIDDGSGFEPGRSSRNGFGLAGMRGRVEEAGGLLEVDSAPGAGTLIRVLLPASVPGLPAAAPS